ncbi:transposase [Streptomyces sp. IBSBF 3010]|uniref:transposase n=1 Tax=Streptomyces sp. IBSBF 3010 TaxID=2903526 RepID=UPI003FA79855
MSCGSCTRRSWSAECPRCVLILFLLACRQRVAPPERRRRYLRRLLVPDRIALAGVLMVTRTGVAWREAPAENVGCFGVTAGRRLRGWTEAGVWPRRTPLC